MKAINSDACLIIPVYNEAAVILDTIKEASELFPTIICVDDGSADDSFDKIMQTKALLVRHPINMGQGAALQTGIDYALTFKGHKYFVTYDADGQHRVEDAANMISFIRKHNVDIVTGSRFLGDAVNITPMKFITLKLAVIFTNIFSGVKLTDTHNGLRVFNRKFAEELDLKMSGMAHASELIDFVGRGNWRYKELPVTIRYTDYSKAKGQSIFNAVNILLDVLLARVK